MFNRKSLLTLSLAGAMMFAGAQAAFAMDQDEAEKKTHKLKRELNLTDDQVKKVQGIYAETMKKEEALRADTRSQVRNVLTDEQKKKFDEMVAKKEAKHHKK